MATRAVTKASLPETGEYDGVAIYSWAGLTKATDDAGAAVDLPSHRPLGVQVTGVFGAGGHVVIEGSIDGTNYATLADVAGSALDLTAAAVKGIAVPALRHIRPRVTAGDADTLLAVSIILRRD